MVEWIQAAGVLITVAMGLWLGVQAARLPRAGWMLLYLAALGVIGLIGVGRRFPRFEFVPPISWFLSGRTEFVLGAFLAALSLSIPLPRLPLARDRRAVVVFIFFFSSLASAWPFLAPVFNRDKLRSLVTRFDVNGVCLQSTDYNCGPAASVTALRRLGIRAEEGEIAILSHTSNAIGTPPDLLAVALQERYGGQGLIARYRSFQSLDELNQDGLTLAVIKFSLFIDHYVAVLDANQERVVLGDPAVGIRVLTPEEFASVWRFTGVVVRRAAGHTRSRLLSPPGLVGASPNGG